jgi:6-phosphogluconolactonase (cycloisomerase 2 family)
MLMLACALVSSGCGNGGVVRQDPPPQSAAFLYASNVGSADISGFKIDGTTGALTEVPGSPFFTVNAPSGLAVHPSSNHLVAGLVTGGLIQSFRFDTFNGTLTAAASASFGVNAPVDVVFARNGQFVYSTEALFPTIPAFSFSSGTGAFTAVPGSPFVGFLARVSGVAVNASGTRLYAVGTFGDGIAVFSINGVTGALTEIPGSPFQVGLLSPSSSHSIALHSSGNFLYVTDPIANVVRAFTVTPSGEVGAEIASSPFLVGVTPSAIVLTSSGSFAFVVNRDSEDVDTFAINVTTGALQFRGSVFAESAPFAATIADSGKFLYVANALSGDISGFLINSNTGELTPVPGSPFESGVQPLFLAATR